MKDLLKDKKIVIIDIETSGLYCGEEGKRLARIIRVDAVKIDNGVIGETFSSLVACGEYIPKHIATLTGISNKILKGAPRIKSVLKQLKEFVAGYEVYARNSSLVNSFLSYYANKNKISIDLAKNDDHDEISRFLRYGAEVNERAEKSTCFEPLALAKLLIEK